MEFSTQIQLSNKGYLDVTENVNAPLNFSVSEIQELQNKQGSYSKTINLPDTHNNRILLGQLFDVNVVDASFNQNLKEPCTIIQRGVPIFDGYLQLKGVNKRSSGQGGLDDILEFEVAVKDFTGGFYSELDKGYLSDFDFSQYNHNYTISAITATSAHTYQDVYKYHLYYNLKNFYELNDFKPGIFALAYWDRIFNHLGYTYEWEGRSKTKFDKMIIPFTGDKVLGATDDLEFRASFSSNTSAVTVYTSGSMGVSSSYAPPNYNELRYKAVIFDDDYTGILNDDNNLYDITTGKYNNNFIGVNTFKSKFYYELYYSARTPCTLVSVGSGAQTLDITAAQTLYANGTDIYPTINFPFFSKSIPLGTVLNTGLTYLGSGLTTDMTATINVIMNEKIQAGAVIQSDHKSTLWKNGSTWVQPDFLLKTGIVNDQGNNYFYNNAVSTAIHENLILRLNDYVPKNIKFKDFVSGIIKLFNLYITPSKDRPRHLIIQTRDEFYDSGKSIDWTDKLDLSRESTIEFLPDLQNKNLLFTYKAGSDDWNKTYQTETGEVYGQAMYTFANQHVQSTKKIETIFEPTPLNESFSGAGFNIVSAIDTVAPKIGLRILYDGGWIDGNPWTYKGVNWPVGQSLPSGTYTKTFNTYPYAGHLYPNPFDPTDDLNFAQTDFLFYDGWHNLTDNNLYNKYYKRLLSQIETGKLFTAYFRLNEFDINTLDLRDKVWIFDTYWFINKIVDYNASNGNGLTKVELINVEEGVKFEPFNLANTQVKRKPPTEWSSVVYAASKANSKQTTILGGSNRAVSIEGTGNILQVGASNMMVTGDDNTLSGDYSIILGNGNRLYSTKSFITGDNNTGSASRSFIIGDNNVVNGDNIFSLGVNNAVLNQSNTTYLGSTMTYVNFISAGRDEVLNPFSTTKLVDYISGSRNAVRSLGSSSIESQIDGGRDVIV